MPAHLNRKQQREIKAVVDVGFSIAEAAIPFTAPKTIKDMSQLKLDL